VWKTGKQEESVEEKNSTSEQVTHAGQDDEGDEERSDRQSARGRRRVRKGLEVANTIFTIWARSPRLAI